LTAPELEKNITEWILYCGKNGMEKKRAGFWILIDFVVGGFGGDYPREYFLKHEKEARAALKGVDKTKGKNKEICEDLERIINERIK
jgi:hypothetical protein